MVKSRSDCAWMNTVDSQLFLLLVYGSHLQNLDKLSTVKTVNTAFRKGIRRGLGMKPRESIRDRFLVILWKHQRNSKTATTLLERVIRSVDVLVQGQAWLYPTETVGLT